MLNISGIKEKNSKPFSSTKNWELGLNTKQFLYDLGGLRYYQNKIGFLRKVIVINFYFLILILRFFERWLKWTRDKNYLSSWGNIRLHRDTWGLSGSVSVCQGLVRAARGYFKAVRSMMCHFVYEFVGKEPHFVSKTSQPPGIIQKWFFIQEVCMDLSFKFVCL